MEIIPNPLVKENNQRSLDEQMRVYRKLRKTWSINPKTRVKQSDKNYKRAKDKQKIKKQIREEL